MKKAIIIGATSGIGQEVAGILVQQGWRIGIAGRREEVLRSMQQANPQQIEIQHLDVTKENAVLHLTELIDRLGGMDLFFLSSGVGYQNRNLEPEIELNTARTNVEGFIRMVTAAFDYFKKTKKDPARLFSTRTEPYCHFYITCSSNSSLIRASTRFSILDTCTCDTPMTFAVWSCVISLKYLKTITCLSLRGRLPIIPLS